MSQKIFLTSALAMGVFAPAFAAPSNTGEFPSTGLMQEDYTYTNAATAENMDSVYEGEVNAVAEYTDILYNIVAGNYLKAGSDATNGTTCPAGSWCPGLTDATYNETADQGINSCPNEYGLSATGASSQNDCYRQCSGNVTIEHATGVTGNDYYDGTNTCAPTSCENGWHPKAAVPNLTNIIGSEVATGSGYKSNNGTGSNWNESQYGITQNGEFVVDYGAKGKIHGHAQCSTQSGSLGTMSNGTYPDITTTTTLPDSSGQNCYCKLDGYTTAGGDTIALSAPWVFNNNVGPSYGGASACASSCALDCATDVNNSLYWSDPAFRATMFDSVQSSPATCEANTITINWSDASQTDIDANNAGTATYGSDVRTPVKAQTKKGKTFRGWRFSKPQQTNLP